MTLTQIDTRLMLFKDYLRYRIDNRMLLPCGILSILKTTGNLFYGDLLTFDQWLYQNEHQDLTDFGFENMPPLPWFEHEESAWLKEYSADGDNEQDAKDNLWEYLTSDIGII